MKRRFISLFVAILMAIPLLAAEKRAAVSNVPVKELTVADIDRHEADMVKLSDEIWAFAETALRETKSSKALADYAEAQGFKVERGVAEMPTAFIATYGEGHPIIGILGEFDALPGISQKAQPTKEALEEGKPGHGCGHNLFGVASLGAAIAIKDLIASGKLKGTIRFYGTPAEESVGGRFTWVARDYSRTWMFVWPGIPTPLTKQIPAAHKRWSISLWNSKEKPPMRLSIRGTGTARRTEWKFSTIPST